MHLFKVAFYASGVLYALFHEQQLLFYFLAVVLIYVLISAFYPGSKSISNRKKIMVSTWTDPSEGVIQVRLPIRTEKVQKVIDQYNKTGGTKLTLTHFVIKGCGVLLHDAADLNGKLTFGKFVPNKTVDVSCLVDIDGGKDLAIIVIKDADKKSVEEISAFVKEKGEKIKKNKGDAEHKNRFAIANHLPAFMVSAFITLAHFLSMKLGIQIPQLALKKNQFGACCITSLGMLGFQDALAPFSGAMDCSFFASVNAVTDSPVVEDGEVKVGKVMNVNFVVDHRYVDGGRAKTFVKAFKQVFENPEQYLKREKEIVLQEQKLQKKNQVEAEKSV